MGRQAPRATLGAASAIRRAVGSTLHKREVQSDTMPFNIGAPELIVILVIALLVIGPGKLPDVGSALGKSIREFRKASSDVQDATRVDASPIPPAPAPQSPPSPPPSEPTTESNR
jgi:sec-independent protein translocase protein TatA